MTKEVNVWLIRTKQNKILGPVSKHKIIDLIAKGTLTPEDEVCSGNGYWFWVKEKELLDKYIYGDIPQDFNPVSEASTIIALQGNSLELEPSKAHESNKESKTNATMVMQNPFAAKGESHSPQESDDVIIPAQEDLEYPEIGHSSSLKNDFTPGSSESLSLKVAPSAALEDKASSEGPIIIPDESDLEYPDFEVKKSVTQEKVEINKPELKLVDDEIDELLSSELANPSIEEATEKSEDLDEEREEEKVEPVKEMPKPVRKKKRRKKVASEKTKDMPKRNDKIVFYLIGLIISIVLYGVYYYYTSILGNEIISKISNTLIPQAYAQSIDLDQKKKFI